MTTQRYERVPAWSMGDRLRKARSLTGLTVAEFAERIGVSDRTVNNAEGDKRAVRRITLNAWSLATGVPVEWLERGTVPVVGPPNPEECAIRDSNAEPADLRHFASGLRLYPIAA